MSYHIRVVFDREPRGKVYLEYVLEEGGLTDHAEHISLYCLGGRYVKIHKKAILYLETWYEHA